MGRTLHEKCGHPQAYPVGRILGQFQAPEREDHDRREHALWYYNGSRSFPVVNRSLVSFIRDCFHLLDLSNPSNKLSLYL